MKTFQLIHCSVIYNTNTNYPVFNFKREQKDSKNKKKKTKKKMHWILMSVSCHFVST